MYTFIDDNELFIIIPQTGRIYRIGMDSNFEPIIKHEDTMSFNADVGRKIVEKLAKLVRD